MRTGRPRKPIELKLLDGTYRKDRDANIGPAVAAQGQPEPPKSLRGAALTFWHEIVPQLVALGIAKAVDSAILAGMCEWHARYVAASVALDKARPSKVAGAMRRCEITWRQFDKIACRFGMTPSDRSRLRMEKPAGLVGVMVRKRQL